MKKKKNLLQENMERFKTKNLDHINEHILGELPSDKLMKMKWNPITNKSMVNEVADPQVDLGLELEKDIPGLKQHGHVGVSQVKIGIGKIDDILRIFTLGKAPAAFGVVDINDPRTYADFTISKGKDFPAEAADLIRGANIPVKGGYDELVNKIRTILRKIQPILANPAPGDSLTTRGTGEEIYDPKPSGGFCKRNLDIDWYFDNILTGKSYLRTNDCGVAVETAQQHTNEFTTGDFASDGNFGPIKVDGKYGPQTKKYIRSVQDFLNLKPDGLFGKKTHDALINAIKNSKSMKIDPIDKEKSIPQLQILAPVEPSANAEFKAKAIKGKEKRTPFRNKIKSMFGKKKKSVSPSQPVVLPKTISQQKGL